jgi:hypothetical protein
MNGETATVPGPVDTVDKLIGSAAWAVDARPVNEWLFGFPKPQSGLQKKNRLLYGFRVLKTELSYHVALNGAWTKALRVLTEGIDVRILDDHAARHVSDCLHVAPSNR